MWLKSHWEEEGWFLTVLVTKIFVLGMPMPLGIHLQWITWSTNVSSAEWPPPTERGRLTFCDHQTTCITLAHSVSWLVCPGTYVLAPGSPRGSSLDSRGRSHPAILSIWEHINFEKPWIGGSSHHMCLSGPFSLHLHQWLSALLSTISPVLPEVRNHGLYRVSSRYKSSFAS